MHNYGYFFKCKVNACICNDRYLYVNAYYSIILYQSKINPCSISYVLLIMAAPINF